MLIMVMENPMQLTTVSEVPLDSSGALWATKVENKGESAMTANPQMNRKVINRMMEGENKKRGESKQHTPEIVKAIIAVFSVPK
jgi:ligand-binding sensor domain-containing protein